MQTEEERLATERRLHRVGRRVVAPLSAAAFVAAGVRMDDGSRFSLPDLLWVAPVAMIALALVGVMLGYTVGLLGGWLAGWAWGGSDFGPEGGELAGTAGAVGGVLAGLVLALYYTAW